MSRDDTPGLAGIKPSRTNCLAAIDEQLKTLEKLRLAAHAYAQVIDTCLPNGKDKDYILSTLCDLAAWANVAITRPASAPAGAPDKS